MRKLYVSHQRTGIVYKQIGSVVGHLQTITVRKYTGNDSVMKNGNSLRFVYFLIVVDLF